MQSLHLCQTCATPFYIDLHRVRRGDGKYCSKPCAAIGQRTKVLYHCQTCGAAFFEKPSIVGNGKGKFCSKKCHIVAQTNSLAVFWKQVQICRHGEDCPYCCWPWQGLCCQDGYGRFHMAKKPYPAHRIAWELRNQQQISVGLVGAHYCHNHPCCNPDHIHATTQKGNLADSSRDGRMPGNPKKRVL